MNQIRFVLGLTILVYSMSACTKMNDIHEPFWRDGEKVYPVFADSVKVYPGENRIELMWLVKGGPTISKAKVFWSNGKNFLEIPVKRTGALDTVRAVINNLTEGSYVFDIYNYDAKGNSSRKVSALGTVYGDNYKEYLLNRVINKAIFDKGSLSITWGAPVDDTALGSELKYTDISGNMRSEYVIPTTTTTVLNDYDFDKNGGEIQTRTMYKPVPMAIDTFYTAYENTRVIGPPVPYSKEGWTAATATNVRYPVENTIDGDASTFWWTADGNITPYTFTVDMGAEEATVDGIFLQQSNRADPHIESFELQISSDGTQWKPAGIYNMEDHRDMQYFDFPNAERFRYFKVIIISVYRGKANASLAEVGVYYR